jgi:hypothetical protein
MSIAMIALHFWQMNKKIINGIMYTERDSKVGFRLRESSRG